MIKRMRFIPKNDYAAEHCQPPIPARAIVPDWYKAAEMFIDHETGLATKEKSSKNTGGLKSCMPFLDTIVSGYFITTWHDLYVRTTDVVEEFYLVEKNPYTGEYQRLENVPEVMISERTGDIGHTMPRPAGYCENHMVLSGVWGIRLPRKWSVLMTHPLNRYELPFFTSSGIIDADEWWPSGNIPFFFKKDFDGIIPAGTPMVQIIPIKRSSWTSYVSHLSNTRNQYMGQKARSVPVGWYRNNIWVKKDYE